jgi:23S rRNA pseudouridine1911/1915/1917 synthase
MSNARTVTESTTLLPFLFAAWPEEKKKQVRTWLKFQAVTVNGRITSQFNHALKSGDVVAIRSDRYTPPDTVILGGLKILHEDATLIVIDKPADLLTIASEKEPEKNAYFQLTSHLRGGNPYARERIWIVHRLDRETSGLMVFAKTEKAKRDLQTGWDRAEKIYQAVVEGSLPKDQGTFDCFLDETNPFRVLVAPRSPATRRAITHYRVIKKSAARSLVELTLETGRRHQIRVHLAHAGCPIIGDSKYRAKTDPARRLALHACRLSFPHPLTLEKMSFTSPLPKLLERLV